MRTYVPQDWRCDPARWNMMIHYCRGYPRWKREVNDIRLEYRAAGGAASSGGDNGSEVERKVERMVRLEDNIELVERCCREAVSRNLKVYPSLLAWVTTTLPADYIPSVVGRRQLSRYRKQFFFLLDEELTKRNVM